MKKKTKEWTPIALGIGSRNGGGFAHPECWFHKAAFEKYRGGSIMMGSIMRTPPKNPCAVCGKQFKKGNEIQ